MLAMAAEHGGNPDDPNKRHPLDFVLWQPSLPDEPARGSRGGARPPGLAHRVLGAGPARAGGDDRCPRRRARPRLPHHECETAQSESVTGQAVRPALAPRRAGRTGRDQDVQVARQPGLRGRPAEGVGAAAVRWPCSTTTTGRTGSGPTRTCPGPPAGSAGLAVRPPSGVPGTVDGTGEAVSPWSGTSTTIWTRRARSARSTSRRRRAVRWSGRGRAVGRYPVVPINPEAGGRVRSPAAPPGGPALHPPTKLEKGDPMAAVTGSTS
jgi:hypothetical protein